MGELNEITNIYNMTIDVLAHKVRDLGILCRGKLFFRLNQYKTKIKTIVLVF